MEEISREEHAQALVEEDPRPNSSSQLKGTRKRKWGSWVSQIRIPRSRENLWLGSYKTAEQAARAYDAAVYCLRGPNAIFNFPHSVPSIPSASSLSRHEIQLAASRYATLDQLPAISPAEHDNNENASANDNKARQDSASPSRSASVQETAPSLSDGQHQQEHALASGENLLARSGDCLTNNLESFPSIDEASALKLIQIPILSWAEQHHEQPEEEDDMNFLDVSDLWNFGNSEEEEEYLLVS